MAQKWKIIHFWATLIALRKNSGLRTRSTTRRIADASRNLAPTVGKLATDVGILDGNPENQGNQDYDQRIFDQALAILLD
jgi:hypothetical protein